ncbi:MAG: hypothetical protein JWO93_98 [Micrococcaceae bacterium]|jgi:uncharacterized membrane protein|nr:hypothetical protein [Micrococcaceae bacterium]
MSPTLLGAAIGAFLAFMAFAFGFWGFVVAALFMVVGAALGRAAEGRLDVRSAWDALTGRRSSS